MATTSTWKRTGPVHLNLPVMNWKRARVTIGPAVSEQVNLPYTYARNAIFMAPTSNANAVTVGPDAENVDVISLDPGASYQVNAGDGVMFLLGDWSCANADLSSTVVVDILWI